MTLRLQKLDWKNRFLISLTILALLSLAALWVWLPIAGPTPREVSEFLDNAERANLSEWDGESRSPDLVIQLLKDGTLLLESSPVSASELSSTLRNLIERKAWIKVQLKAESDLEHGRVVEIQDLCREAGVTNITLHTVTPQNQ